MWNDSVRIQCIGMRLRINQNVSYACRFVSVSHVLRTANSRSTVRCTSLNHTAYCGFSFWILKNFDCERNQRDKSKKKRSHETFDEWFDSMSIALQNGTKSVCPLTLTHSTVSPVIGPVGSAGTLGNIVGITDDCAVKTCIEGTETKIFSVFLWLNLTIRYAVESTVDSNDTANSFHSIRTWSIVNVNAMNASRVNVWKKFILSFVVEDLNKKIYAKKIKCGK